MLFAVDHNDNRVHINDTISKLTYYCPCCGTELITKKGEIRQHHFAHKAHHECSDTWSKKYDISPWHDEWQEQYPKDNQEVKVSLGNISHRADVMIGRTVIEFQHSLISVKGFDNRNAFYSSLGYKVIWLFDLSEFYTSGQITDMVRNGVLTFRWKNPKRAINQYDVKTGCIDLFFQLKEDGLVRVDDLSDTGFEEFYCSRWIDKNGFLVYTGLVEGNCAKPCLDDPYSSESYLAFKEQYCPNLNKQQERAMQTLNGAILTLAVPGSGKTTMMVARLGYMVNERGIIPENILALSYNREAAAEIKKRLASQFGSTACDRIEVLTINALCNDIYRRHYSALGHRVRRSICKDLVALEREVMRSFGSRSFIPENDRIEFETAITYAKNMQLSGKERTEIDRFIPSFSAMYDQYTSSLAAEDKMDFDDQLVFAYEILRKEPSILNALCARYRYICVDEAQDTSKLQHSLIQLLASGGNIFMVGDEDQSIYGFRAAYPKALLNFRTDYNNPYILRMETNYRSTPQIVAVASAFINRNQGRFEKNMIAAKPDGRPVQSVVVQDRQAQWAYLLEMVKNRTQQVAFLFRDNSSAVPLVDMLLHAGIPFQHKKAEYNFFQDRDIRYIKAYLILTVKNCGKEAADALEELFRCDSRLKIIKPNTQKYILEGCRQRKSIEVVFEEQKGYLHGKYSGVEQFLADLAAYKSNSAAKAVNDIARKLSTSDDKMEIIQFLAKSEPSIPAFISRLDYLEKVMTGDQVCSAENPVILSTIHSSKGLEYDSVYLVDIYDGKFPSDRESYFTMSKDSSDLTQEERRLFYVGITRTKNLLTLIHIKERNSCYISELEGTGLLEIQKDRHLILLEEAEKEKARKKAEAEEKARIDALLHRQREEAEAERVRKEQEAKLQAAEKAKYEKRIRDMKQSGRLEILRQTAADYIEDYDKSKPYVCFGVRWIKCHCCHKVGLETEFVSGSYGGNNRENIGTCLECSNRRWNDA